MSSGGTAAAAAGPVRHHPSEATLVARAAGTLDRAAGFVVAAHLARCPDCRAKACLAEAMGGLLLADLAPTPLAGDALRRTLERLGEPEPATVPRPMEPQPGMLLPLPAGHRLRWLAPGLRHALLLRGSDGETLRLLRVRPGTALPRHAHRGTELTCVLEGAFLDETGRYGPGDLAEVEEGVSHQPVAEGPADCVCLVAARGRLRFGGLLARLLQPLLRI